MTLSEVEKKLDELYKTHGVNYVVHAGNHPEILRALNDDIVAKMEAEREEIVTTQKRKLEDLSVEELCEIAAQAGQDAGRRAAEAAAGREAHDDE